MISHEYIGDYLITRQEYPLTEKPDYEDKSSITIRINVLCF